MILTFGSSPAVPTVVSLTRLSLVRYRESMKVNIHDAKTHLSRLVDRAAAGEEITIARAGKPVAKLVPYQVPVERRVPGTWRGQVWMAPDFDATDEQLIALFENGE